MMERAHGFNHWLGGFLRRTTAQLSPLATTSSAG
jgi:hypothetical protein